MEDVSPLSRLSNAMCVSVLSVFVKFCEYLAVFFSIRRRCLEGCYKAVVRVQMFFTVFQLDADLRLAFVCSRGC